MAPRKLAPLLIPLVLLGLLAVAFVLVLSTACSLFLAATTGSTVMLYVFALSFLGLCGYVYLLSQSRQRSQMSGYDGWFDTH